MFLAEDLHVIFTFIVHPYIYQWLKITSPENSHGYMEGKNAQRVVLTKV